MVDPTTVNKLLAVPSRGSNVGVWDTPVNADFTALDGMLGGVASITLASATTITLSIATGSVTPSAGPTQSQNAMLKFTGTLTGNCIIKFTLPGFYIIDNRCVVGTSYLQLSPSSGTGNSIGAPDGQKTWVFFDGTDVDYVNIDKTGTYLDLAVATTPAWMNACTVAQYLLCNGAIYSTSVYPILGPKLGSTFGGNGITTFGVPDTQNRARVPIDFGGNLRLTAGTAGITGTQFGSAGGSQSMQSHRHTLAAIKASNLQAGVPEGLNFSVAVSVGSGQQTDLTGNGASQNVQPTVVHGITLIKT